MESDNYTKEEVNEIISEELQPLQQTITELILDIQEITEKLMLNGI
jgi:hypothetical protein